MANIVSKIQTNASTTYNITESNVNLAICSTAASTAAKTVTIPGFTASDLVDGATVTVFFANTNTATNPTLNVSGTGAKAITCHGVDVHPGNTPDTSWYGEEIVKFVYWKGAGTTGYWQMQRLQIPNPKEVDSVVYNNETYYFWKIVSNLQYGNLKWYFTINAEGQNTIIKFYNPSQGLTESISVADIDSVAAKENLINQNHHIDANYVDAGLQTTYKWINDFADVLIKSSSGTSRTYYNIGTIETNLTNMQTDYGKTLAISGNTILLKNKNGTQLSSINLPVWDGTIE